MTERESKRFSVGGIRFPSDRVTIKMLRQHHPQLFDEMLADGDDQQPMFFEPGGCDHAEDQLGSMMYVERLIAKNRYAAELGIEIPDQFIPLADMKIELAQHYVRYGLATGVHEAEELIRDIERQAKKLAESPYR